MHLQHSLINVLQTLGITSKTYALAIISAVVLLILGFASVPLYIWASA
jgi:succinate dehydrogenase / fumarate reductase cytochrome b subunit